MGRWSGFGREIDGIGTLVNPILIIEVVSENSKAIWSRTTKFTSLNPFPTFQEYLLIAQRASRHSVCETAGYHQADEVTDHEWQCLLPSIDYIGAQRVYQDI